MSVREGAPQGRQGSQVKDLAPRNAGWVVVRGNMHGDVRCPRRARWSEPLSAPRPSSHVSGSALRAALCQEESLPGHHGSPGAAMQRMSALSAGEGGPFRPAPNTPTPQRHAPTRPLPRSAVATATGLRAQSAVYSQPSARKLGREAARRTSLGGGGREPVIGHKGH